MAADERQRRYRAFWRRGIAGAYRSSGADEPHVDVYAFRPTWKPWAPAHTYFVYISGGMSDAEMTLPDSTWAYSRMELSCYALSAPGFGDPRQDEIARWMHALARLPFQEQQQAFNPGDTLNVGKPLAPDSEMSAFYFAHTPFVDREALKVATICAGAVAHLIPISEAERSLAECEGSAALVEAMERAAVPPVFDLARRSCV